MLVLGYIVALIGAGLAFFYGLWRLHLSRRSGSILETTGALAVVLATSAFISIDPWTVMRTAKQLVQ